MTNHTEDSMVFADTPEFENRTPIQNVLLDVINSVNQRILKFYMTPESRHSNIRPPEMLVMVTANIFANLAQNLMYPRDSASKVGAFNVINDELHSLSKRLFLMLETYYNADEQKIN